MTAHATGARLPDLDGLMGGADWGSLRLEAVEGLIEVLRGHLTAAPIADLTALEDLSFRHLAKATGSSRAAVLLLRDGSHSDACILIRAVFEQLFTYMWVFQGPTDALARHTMVTLKQEWANAKYLEGLAAVAEGVHGEVLAAESRACRTVADALMAQLAAELDTTEKKVRDEATRKVSAKAVEINLGPEFSVPYAYYSGFAHSDGNALASYGRETSEGHVFCIKGVSPAHVPPARDLHRVLLRLAREIVARCPRLPWAGVESVLATHEAWLLKINALSSQ